MNRTALQILQDQLLGLDKHSKVEIHYPDDLLADGDPLDNRPENLCWGTAEQNAADRVAHGKQSRGQRAGGAKLKDADIPVIMQLLTERVTAPEIAKRFGVSKHTITGVKNGLAWNHITGIPRPESFARAMKTRNKVRSVEYQRKMTK